MPFRKKSVPPIGQKFGRLTVTGEAYVKQGRWGSWDWVCRCDCGEIVTARSISIRNGHTASCGCLHRETQVARFYRHGIARSHLYQTWQGMLQRCENENNAAFAEYGARGISVCKRWQMFENFAADMGERPSPTYSIDRIDNNKGYSPDNCRWATKKEQVLNTRWSMAKRQRIIIKAGHAFLAKETKMKASDVESVITKVRGQVRREQNPLLKERYSLLAMQLENGVSRDFIQRQLEVMATQSSGVTT